MKIRRIEKETSANWLSSVGFVQQFKQSSADVYGNSHDNALTDAYKKNCTCQQLTDITSY